MSMKCAVYRSNRKDLTYLYLPEKDDMSRVPDALLEMIEPVERVLEFDLTPDRALAQESALDVLKQLEEQGWFLQMPRDDKPEYMI
ncbi:YcgL domain-containing protein [Pseudomonadota bacterium]